MDMKITPLTAPDLLIEAADIIANRAAQRDTDSERSMGLAVSMFNLWRDRDGSGFLTEDEGWVFMVFLKLARAANGGFVRDDYIDGAAYLALACECLERSAVSGLKG